MNGAKGSARDAPEAGPVVDRHDGRRTSVGGQDRLRRLAASIVLAAAVLITAATSYMDAELAERVDGAPFLVTPEAPAVTIPVTFDATREALRRGSSVSFHVRHTVVWTGVDDPAPERLEMALLHHDPASGRWIPVGDPRCHADRCTTTCWGADCVGSYEVMFRWPEELPEGSARVEWSVDAVASWPDDGGFFSRTPTVPDGAELAIRFGDRTGGEVAPERVAAWQSDVDPEVGAIAESVTVVTYAPLDGGAVALEAVFDEESLRVGIAEGWEVGEPPVPLRTATSLPATVPAACHDGPCTFTFTTLGQLADPSMPSRYPSSVQWAITATTPVDVEVVSRSVALPEVVAQAGIGRVVLHGGDATERIRLVVAIPAEALPEGEWSPGYIDQQERHDQGGTSAEEQGNLARRPERGGPIVALRLRPEIDPDTLTMLPRPGVEVEVTTAANRTATHGPTERRAWVESSKSPHEWGPWQTPLANRCRPAEACEIDVDILVRQVEPLEDDDRVVAFDLHAEVAVLLPWTQPTPSASPDIRVVTGSP